MSQEWLDYQGFIADHDVVQAITDLSIATKLELSGVEDIQINTDAARDTLDAFLLTLSRMQRSDQSGSVVEGDRNLREIADAFRMARSDSSRFKSVLIRSGAEAGRALLNAVDRPAKQALIESLEELRRVVSGHRTSTLSAIIEEF